MRRYNPKVIEPKWQKIWHDTKIYEVDTTKKPENKFYIIPMFPYPSGDAHIGHWYNFAPTDTVARCRRMLGHQVLHVNGFDSFGLPAENAAIKRGIPPAEWTKKNIESMTKQIEAIGASYDWTKQVITSEPGYYRWTQWLFLKLYEKGLAYRKKALVNWCPKDQTVLANEQVVGEDNVCERCGTPVIQKELEQWYFKITDYADRLLEDAEALDWPERVKTMQKNWIGKSKGAEINFAVVSSKYQGVSEETIKVFTTRADTIFGAAFLVLAPEHPLVNKLNTERQKADVENYVRQALRKTELERKEEKEKAGVFTGSYAINPANNEKMPIWIADFVVGSYGTGALFGDIHDERDFEFIKKFNIPARVTVIPEDKEEAKRVEAQEYAYTGEGILIDSGEFSGQRSELAREKIIAWLARKDAAKEQTNYKLRDWLISRQRYWGTPIPMIYCEKCGLQPVPENQLPVLLPENVEFEPTGQSPLLQDKNFVNTECPKCDGPARRETDTMDTFVDSSWYFLRYPNPNHKDSPFNLEIIKNWAPVDHYIGGIEHAILHLLYSRFITKFLHDHHKLPFEEPFKKLSNQGMILGPDGLKMSKSRGNVVNPDSQANDYGSDSLRLHLMFMGPYDQGGLYNIGGIAGTRRFLDRFWTLTQEFLETKPSTVAHNAKLETQIAQIVHKATKKVTEDLQTLSFNTAIAALMECVNKLYKIKSQDNFSLAYKIWHENLEKLVQLLAPFAPHITEELWGQLGNKDSVHLSQWPTWDEDLIKEQLITLAVQINGKVRGEILAEADIGEKEAIEAAKNDGKVAKSLAGKKIKKAIYVQGRLVSLVV